MFSENSQLCNVFLKTGVKNKHKFKLIIAVSYCSYIFFVTRAISKCNKHYYLLHIDVIVYLTKQCPCYYGKCIQVQSTNSTFTVRHCCSTSLWILIHILLICFQISILPYFLVASLSLFPSFSSTLPFAFIFSFPSF